MKVLISACLILPGDAASPSFASAETLSGGEGTSDEGAAFFTDSWVIVTSLAPLVRQIHGKSQSATMPRQSRPGIAERARTSRLSAPLLCRVAISRSQPHLDFATLSLSGVIEEMFVRGYETECSILNVDECRQMTHRQRQRSCSLSDREVRVGSSGGNVLDVASIPILYIISHFIISY